jgi:WD40 repeat protein
VWDVATGKPVSPPLSHPETVRGGAFTPDRRLAITAGYDRLIRFWDCSTWELSGEPIKLPAQAMAMALSRDGLFLAVGCNSGEAFVYDVPGRRLMSPLLRHPAPLAAVRFHPDDGLLATGCADSTARLWDWSSGRQVGRRSSTRTRNARLQPDGRARHRRRRFTHVWDLPLRRGLR